VISRRAALATISGAMCLPVTAQAWSRKPNFYTSSLASSSGRKIDISLFAPRTILPRFGMLAFSHGSNSHPNLYVPLLQAFASAGFLVAAPVHVDSERYEDRAKFDQAAIFQTRLEDLKLVIDSATQLATAAEVDVAKFDVASLVVAGHSYGAWQALMLAGAGCSAFGIGGGQVRDAKIKAALAVSPPGGVPGMISGEDYSSISTPIMITTGRRDILPGFVERWQDRLLAYERATGPAAALVLGDVDHYFGGAIGRDTVPGPPQKRSLEVTSLALTRFARAYSLGDRTSLSQLQAMSRRALDLRLRN
jgi:pimeloyl-ACP methyl ester carboxylesterase